MIYIDDCVVGLVPIRIDGEHSRPCRDPDCPCFRDGFLTATNEKEMLGFWRTYMGIYSGDSTATT